MITYLKVQNNNLMRYLKIIFFILISSNLSLSQIDRSKPPKSGPSPSIDLGNPKSFELDNGLKVIVVENNKLPRAFANLDIDNYPDYEGDIKGVSSILGAMMGNGTKINLKTVIMRKLITWELLFSYLQVVVMCLPSRDTFQES